MAGGLMKYRFALSCAAGGAVGARGDGRRRSLAGLAVAGALTVALGACAGPGAEPEQASLAGAPARESSLPDPTDPQIDPGPTDGETVAGGQPWDARATRTCSAAVPSGFDQVAQSPDDAGTTTFWTLGRRWVACDVAAAAGVGPALFSSPKRAGAPGFDARSLAVTTSVIEGADGEPAAVRVFAGGRLPWRVQELSYTFPDGHTEQARFVTSETTPDEVWWSVTYTPTEGVLADPGVREADLEAVTISIVGAAAEAFRLPWKELQRSE
ncbi:MAG TPA: hypothetical protein VLB29_03120 [Nocardioidaceae bacterium]|nr:hypothetical protein [Nocardioidaceae bacterium]